MHSEWNVLRDTTVFARVLTLDWLLVEGQSFRVLMSWLVTDHELFWLILCLKFGYNRQDILTHNTSFQPSGSSSDYWIQLIFVARSSTMIFKERKKYPWALPNVTTNAILFSFSEFDYIRELLNKNHTGKVPSKTAKSWIMKLPYSANYYQIII